LLHVNFVFGDELETIYEGCYETKDTSIFTWSSILGIEHYHWLRSSICRLHPNSKGILPSSHHSTHPRFPIVMNYYCGIA
jgi:hypothetical protein